MACRCKERRAAIASAISNPASVLTVSKFVIKSTKQDLQLAVQTSADKAREWLKLRNKA